MIVILCVILGLTHALKVLVAGDQHSTFHESVAIQIARGGPHSVFKTSMLVGPNYKAKSKEEGVTLFGIGQHADKFVEIEGESWLDR